MMIFIDAEQLQDGLHNIKDGKIYKYKAKGGTVRAYKLENRPQGEWIYTDDDVFAGEYTCSNCNKRAEVDLYGQWILSNYCPNCGAKMKQ